MAMSKTEELELVEEAMRDILTGGQSTAYQGRSLTMANYDSLVKRKTQLEAEIANATAGGRSMITNVTPLS